MKKSEQRALIKLALQKLREMEDQAALASSQLNRSINDARQARTDLNDFRKLIALLKKP